jgi:hypothetical protein
VKQLDRNYTIYCIDQLLYFQVLKKGSFQLKKKKKKPSSKSKGSKRGGGFFAKSKKTYDDKYSPNNGIVFSTSISFSPILINNQL